MFLKKCLKSNLIGSGAVAAIALCVLFFAGWLSPVQSAEAAEKPSVSAQAAVVFCVDTGEVLFAKNEREHLAMASTTKIMTTLLTLEAAAKDNKSVTITEEMVLVEGSSMGLKPGDRLRLRELAIGMLMVSGNDAANSAAIALSGSTEQFAALMNQRAAELGMEDTSFVTPSGLDDEEHYSTALDMAKLGAAAICNQDFREICRQISMQATWEKPEKTVSLPNHNRLLKLYDGCIGIKTGFTKKAGRCLVSAAERNGITLVAVTLHAPNDWEDHQKMLDYGFAQVSSYSLAKDAMEYTVPVVGGTVAEVQVKCTPEDSTIIHKAGQQVTRTVELAPFVYGPVEQGEVLGTITYQVDGETVLTLPLAAEEAVGVQEIHQNFWSRITGWFLAIFS